MERSFLQIVKTEFNLGLNKEYRFFQISDMHFAILDEQSSEIDINDFTRYHKQWDSLKYELARQNNEFCDERYDVEPNIIFEKLCNHAQGEFNADLIICSGDLFDRVSESNIRYLSNYKKTLSVPIIYCPGNHEHMNEKGNHINQKHRLKDFMDENGIEILDFEDFLLVSFDNGSDDITDYQVEKFKEIIETNKKILLVIHKPLNMGDFGNNLLGKFGSYFFMGKPGDSENIKKIIKLIEDNDMHFIAVLCGHIHSVQEYKITENLIQISTSSGLIGAGREIIIK